MLFICAIKILMPEPQLLQLCNKMLTALNKAVKIILECENTW